MVVNNAVDNGGAAKGIVAEGIAAEYGDIGVLAGLQRTHAVFKAQNLCGVDGDGLKGILIAQAMGDGYADVYGQDLREGRRILGKAEVYAGLFQNAGVIERSVPYLHLGGLHIQRADDGGDIFLLEEVLYHIAFGAVLYDEVEVELLGNADGRDDIVIAVGMDTALHLAPDDGHQGLQLEIGLGGFLAFLFGLELGVGICLGVKEGLPQNGGDAHAGVGQHMAGAVDILGVLAEGHLHHFGAGDHDIIYRLAGLCLEGDSGAAQDIGRTGACIAGGEAGVPGDLDSHILGIKAVDTPYLAGVGRGRLVAVMDDRPGLGLGKGRDMGMDIYKARGDPAALGADDLGALGNGHIGPDGRYLAVFDKYIALFNNAVCNGKQLSAFNGYHLKSTPF